MLSGLPGVRGTFPGILVSLPPFSFKHFTVIKRDIFGHVCVCCRRTLVAVRMSVNQTRQILGLVWVRNQFCVSSKSSRILPDAPTTELLVWEFCLALPFLFSAQLSQPLAAQSPGYLQPSGWWLFQVPVSPASCKQCQGTGSEHDKSAIMLILFCQISFIRACAGYLWLQWGQWCFISSLCPQNARQPQAEQCNISLALSSAAWPLPYLGQHEEVTLQSWAFQRTCKN